MSSFLDRNAGTLTRLRRNAQRQRSAGLSVQEGNGTTMGVVTLVAGTATVTTVRVQANSRIFLTHQNNSGTIGIPTVSARTPGTDFTITSTDAGDTSDIAWVIITPG